MGCIGGVRVKKRKKVNTELHTEIQTLKKKHAVALRELEAIGGTQIEAIEAALSEIENPSTEPAGTPGSVMRMAWEIGNKFAAIRVKLESLAEPVWEDAPTPEDFVISEAFPTRSGDHASYAEAMRLVGARRSKGTLVALVNWLLHRVKVAESRAMWSVSDVVALKDAVKFYADPKNHTREDHYSSETQDFPYSTSPSEVMKDGGLRARDALAAIAEKSLWRK